jgi:hypothetical protein
VVIDTTLPTPEESALKIVGYLTRQGFLGAGER